MTSFVELNKKSCADKHKIYAEQYQKSTTYWGLGIENEVYLEFEKPYFVKRSDFKNHKSERYSVNYFKNYKPEFLEKAIQETMDVLVDVSTPSLAVPILVNAHSFTKTDIFNEPQTLYARGTPKNPRFSGKTWIQVLAEEDPFFEENFSKSWMFDGDTIEFVTRRFYNTTLDNVVQELSSSKVEFIEKLNHVMKKHNIFQDYSPIHVMKKNHPFVSYMTNVGNLAMFNNGTLHYNITLPTALDENSKIANWNSFVETHRSAIRAIQWIEPFLLAVYGSPDPFVNFTKNCKDQVCHASQRCAMSRYIGIGTFDTEQMTRGKILTAKIENLSCAKVEGWWFNEYYKDNGYNRLDEMGMDINFNKNFNHGIEIRFLDHLTDVNDVKHSFECIIYLMDLVLDKLAKGETFENPIQSSLWNRVVVQSMKQGREYVLSQEEQDFFLNLWGETNPFTKSTISGIFEELYNRLKERYHGKGEFSKLVLPRISENSENSPKVSDLGQRYDNSEKGASNIPEIPQKSENSPKVSDLGSSVEILKVEKGPMNGPKTEITTFLQNSISQKNTRTEPFLGETSTSTFQILSNTKTLNSVKSELVSSQNGNSVQPFFQPIQSRSIPNLQQRAVPNMMSRPVVPNMQQRAVQNVSNPNMMPRPVVPNMQQRTVQNVPRPIVPNMQQRTAQNAPRPVVPNMQQRPSQNVPNPNMMPRQLTPNTQPSQTNSSRNKKQCTIM
jgi:hypothetical protein